MSFQGDVRSKTLETVDLCVQELKKMVVSAVEDLVTVTEKERRVAMFQARRRFDAELVFRVTARRLRRDPKHAAGCLVRHMLSVGFARGTFC